MIAFSLISKSLPKPRFSPVWASALAPLLLTSLSKDPGWMLEKNSTGKPFACNQLSGKTAFVSISHSRRLLAVAVSLTVPVGIDIEFQRQRDFQELATYAFGNEEQTLVQREGSSAFYRIWTAREAVAKATGINLYDCMDGTDILTPGGNPLRLQGRSFLMFHKEVLSTYSLTLVAEKVGETTPAPCEAPVPIVAAAINDIRSRKETNPSENMAPMEIGPLSPM